MDTMYIFENSQTNEKAEITRDSLLELVLNHFGDGGMNPNGTGRVMLIMSEIDSANGPYYLTKNCSVTRIKENI